LKNKNGVEHTAKDKNRLYASYEELGADLLEDVPFDAVAFGVMKTRGQLSADEEQSAEIWLHERA
jgi:hypothetical protein